GEGRDLTRDAGDTEQVATVRLDVEVDHRVAEQLAQRDAERCVFGQNVDARVIVAQSQFAWRAEHALREDDHRLLPRYDHHADLRAKRRQRYLVMQFDVARAADNAVLALTIGDAGGAEVIGAFDRLQPDDLRRDDPRPGILDAIYFQPVQRQRVR